MRKLFMILAILVNSLAHAQTRGWSFYGNIGVGSSSEVTLRGLTLGAEDAAYFKQRGITPTFTSEGKMQYVPTFTLGASYDIHQFRISMQMGSQYVKQSNYHANNISADILVGYDFLKSAYHELSLSTGAGIYNLFNNYVYDWQGLNSNDDVLEHRTVNFGRHDVHTFSVPLKLAYSYQIASHHWLGIYAQGRYNTASDTFCPKMVASAGIEYRYTLAGGKRKAKKRASTNGLTLIIYYFSCIAARH